MHNSAQLLDKFIGEFENEFVEYSKFYFILFNFSNLFTHKKKLQ